MPRIQHKRGTSANLASVNPTPLAGELVWDSTENAIKIGDGATAWSSLAYVTATPRSHSHDGADITTGTVAYARLPVGSTTSTVCAGDDARLTDARTPTAHKASHATGGSDALSPSDLGAAPAASPAITGNATFSASSGVPVTITNTGTGNSFVVNDAAGDTTPFVVDADGKVGIRGATPSSLHSLFNTLCVGTGGAAAQGITIFSQSVCTLAFGDTAAGDTADSARGYVAYTHTTDTLTIGTNNATRITVDSTGKVGVNRTSPATALDVNGVITVSATSGSAGSYLPSVCISGDPNTGFGQVSGQSDTASIFTAGSERVRVDASGRLLVGATSGTYPFTVVSNSSALAVEIRGRVTGNIGVVDFTSNDGATRYGRFDGRPAYFQMRGPENAYITLAKYTGESVFEVHHSGKVKFVPMAADPAEGLEGDVYFNSVTNALTWHDGVRWVAAAPTFNPTFTVKVTVPAGTAADPALVFSGDTNTGIAQIGGADSWSVVTAGVERVRVTSSGTVGIGTASIDSGVTLDTRGTIQAKAAGVKIQAVDSSVIVKAQASNATSEGIVGTESNHNLAIRANNVAALRVKTTGALRFVPLSADPASGEAGDVYYNSSTNKLRVYNGTSWIDLH